MRTVTRVLAPALLVVALGVAALQVRPASAVPAAAPAAAPAPTTPAVTRAVAHEPPAVTVQRPAKAPARRVAVPAKPRKKVAVTPVARAVTKVAPRPAESYLARGNRVLASLRYDWHKLGYRVQFLPGKKGYLGMTLGAQKLVQVYVRADQSDLVLAHTIAHELGHVLDFTRGTAERRAQYLRTRHLSTGLDWFGCMGCTDYRTPAGDWAEVFAYWLAGPGDFRSEVAGAPSKAQLAVLDALFRV
jgi:glucose/arabinose dehydrogenase